MKRAVVSVVGLLSVVCMSVGATGRATAAEGAVSRQKFLDDTQAKDVSVRTRNGLTVKGKFHTILGNVEDAGYNCAVDTEEATGFVVLCTGYVEGSRRLDPGDRWAFTFRNVNEKEVELTRAYASKTGKEVAGPEIEGLADLLVKPMEGRPRTDRRESGVMSPSASGDAAADSQSYTPALGSPERVAIMDAIRLATDWTVSFKVAHLVVVRRGNRAIAVADVSDASGRADNDGIFELEGLNRQWRALYLVGGDGVGKVDEYSAPHESLPPSFWRLVGQNRSADACGMAREF